MNKRACRFIIGLLIGVIGLALGLLLLALIFTKVHGISFSYITSNFDLIASAGPTQLMTGALIPNFILFYLFMRKQKNMFAQGVMIISIVAIIISILN